MSVYTDLFLRANLQDTGSIPATGTPSSSPDIIPYGTAPVNDPGKFFSDNYGSDVGQNLLANAQNYIYVRSKNLGTVAEAGTVSLYYAKASLLLYPSLWQNNILQTSNGLTAVPISAPKANGIAVTTNPFTWQPQMISGDHYCMIGQIVTPNNPNPIPPTGGIQDFAAWITNNRGMGWRNVAIVDNGSPTFVQSVQYDQGNLSGAMSVLITCTNVPVGASVAFSAGTPGPVPLVNLPPTQVTNAGSFVVGVSTNIPANWSSELTYSYWGNGTTPLPGWSIAMSVIYIVPSDNPLFELGLTLEELGLDGEEHLRSLNESLGIGPKRGILVGGHKTQSN